MAVETGAPYTATLVTTVHYLDQATGEMKSVSLSTLQARDGAGRKRDEVDMPRPDGHGGTISAHEVSISDPVSHCSFRWQEPWTAPGEPTAVVTCMPRTVHYTNQNVFAEGIVTEPREEHFLNTVYRSVPLGARMFGEWKAVGVRRTVTTTQPETGIVSRLVSDLWYSPGLKEMLEMKEVPEPKPKKEASPIPDFELTDIHRGEPDPAMFYPPAGYRIEAGH